MNVIAFESGKHLFRCLNADMDGGDDNISGTLTLDHSIKEGDFEKTLDEIEESGGVLHVTTLGRYIRVEISYVDFIYGTDDILIVYVNAEISEVKKNKKFEALKKRLAYLANFPPKEDTTGDTKPDLFLEMFGLPIEPSLENFCIYRQNTKKDKLSKS